MDTTQIVEPGRYDYELKVEFPSTYIPEHTPPAFRNAYAQQTTRTRSAFGQFDLTEHVGREVIRNVLVKQICEDVNLQDVRVARFELTVATA